MGEMKSLGIRRLTKNLAAMVKIPAVADSLLLVSLAAVASASPIENGGGGHGHGHTPACSGFTNPSLNGAKILSIASSELLNYTVPAVAPLGLKDPINNINVCSVTVTYTHPGANDTVNVQIWLPKNNYNGDVRLGWRQCLGDGPRAAFPRTCCRAGVCHRRL